MRYYDNVVELIGNTPLVRLRNVTAGISATVLAKVEYLNPGGSVKDRIALRMVEEAEKAGLLQPGGTIVEPTSGNTGVGLAFVAQLRGYKCVFVCPDKVSEDKQNVLRAYGAEVVVCPTAVAPEDPRSYYNVSDRLAREIPGAWKPDQYANPANPRSHYETTGPELWEQTEGRITHFVAGVGTGGTISGVGHYLKEVSGGRVRVIGADPEGSVYSGGTGRPYLVEGVGEDFWPTTYDRAVARRDRRGLRQGLVRDDPAAGPRGGPAGRRLLRDGRGGGAQGRPRGRPGRRRRRAAAGRRPRLPVEDLQRRVDGALRLPAHRRARPRPWPTCCAARTASMPPLVHVHPNETVRDAIDYMREYGVSQLPVLKAEPPVVTGEVAGSIAERDLLDALFTGQAHLHDTVERHMADAAADDRRRPAGRRGGRPAGEGRRRRGADRRQAGRRDHAAGPARPPRLTALCRYFGEVVAKNGVYWLTQP